MVDKSITLYAIVVHSVRTILIDQHGQVIAYSNISNPTDDDLRELASDTYPHVKASDWMVRWSKQREQYCIEYIPY